MKAPIFTGKTALPPVVPPPDVEVVRFFNHREYGQLPVVKRQVLVGVERTPKVRSDGKLVMRKSNHPNAPEVVVMEKREIWETRESLLVPDIKGNLRYQDVFEPSAEEMAQRARRAQAQTLMENLSNVFLDAGLTMDNAEEWAPNLKMLLQGKAEPAELGESETKPRPKRATKKATAQPVPEPEVEAKPRPDPWPGFELLMSGPGVWSMPVGPSFRGTRSEAMAFLDELRRTHDPGGTE